MGVRSLRILHRLLPAVLGLAVLGISAAPARAQMEGGNLGLAKGVADLAADGDLAAFFVDELGQGGADLDRDGLIDDQVLHVFDAAAGRTSNVGVPRRAASMLEVGGGMATFSLAEQGVQRDLNEDGDLDDSLLQIFAAASQQTHNTKLAAAGIAFSEDRVAFGVGEGLQGVDLNGDGDLQDAVLHVFDRTSGTVTNVGLQTIGFVVGFLRQPIVDAAFALAGNRFVVAVGEPMQGGRDLNGDGDAIDIVLHAIDAAGQVTNLGLAVDAVQVSQDGGARALVSFFVPEAGQGGMDLNGDSDALDSVAHVFEAATQTVKSAQLAAGGPAQVAGSLVAVPVRESDQGARDLNGDGDADDLVLHVFDAAAGSAASTALALRPPDDLQPVTVQLSDSAVAFRVSESGQQADLNGDGDTLDDVLHAFDPSRREAMSLAVAASAFLVAGPRVALVVDASEGGSAGDEGSRAAAATAAGTLQLLDVRDRRVQRTGLQAFDVAAGDGIVAFRSDERMQPAGDLNGDGDTDDGLVFVLDTQSGEMRPLLNSDEPPRVVGTSVVFSVPEARLGDAGTDLNGDGDVQDAVLHVHDARANATRNLGKAAAVADARLGAAVLTFSVSELQQGQADLNGDGDTADLVVHAVALPSARAQN